eukprot:m.37506 g.37506  ORF g.37506 m.37506 type:complete len:741 (+) comp9320_c0_seq4:164-2386(+)
MFFVVLLNFVAASGSTHRWGVYERNFTSLNTTRQNPYLEVSMNVTFRMSSGASFLLPAFWDGGQVWKVRFTPPSTGEWSWVSECSDTADSGLHGVIGSMTATEYTGTNQLYMHGLLQASPNNRYLEHVDGTPFYWLGDTHWSGISSAEHWGDTNNNSFGNGSMFKELVDTRFKQGYSVWKAESFAINGGETGNPPVNDGGFAWLGGAAGFLKNMNPKFWQDVDRRLAYVNSAGIVVSLAFAGIGRGFTSLDMESGIKLLARYNVARYAAYHTVWTTCQEYCAVQGGQPIIDAWGRVAAYQYALDPYKRPNSMHNCFNNPIAFHDQPWYTHVTLQQGHHMVSNVNHWLQQYNAVPPRPIVEDEANYELLFYGSHPGTPVPSWMTRQSAWQSQMGGSFGFTYGGQGIWWACFNTSYVNGNCGTNGSPNFKTWYQALDFEVGGYQLSYMAKFFRQIQWWELIPDATAITWDNHAPQDTQFPVQKATLNRSTIVAYLPQYSANPATCACVEGNQTTGVVQGLQSSSKYSAMWFNPRTGESQTISNFITPEANGTWQLPPKPSEALDYVFLMQEVGRGPMFQPIVSHPKDVLSWIKTVDVKGRSRQVSSQVGCKLRSTGDFITVHSLGRWFLHGNCNLQTLVLEEAVSGKVLASVQVEMKASAVGQDGFVQIPLKAPVSLSPGMDYVLSSVETGCDAWLDDTATTLTTTGDINCSSVYGGKGAWSPGGGGSGHCYGPLNIYYSKP